MKIKITFNLTEEDREAIRRETQQPAATYDLCRNAIMNQVDWWLSELKERGLEEE